MRLACGDDRVTVFQFFCRGTCIASPFPPGQPTRDSSYVTAYALSTRARHVRSGARRVRCGRGCPRGPPGGRRAAENETHVTTSTESGPMREGDHAPYSPHHPPQPHVGRVRRRRLYGVPTRRRAHRLTRETCGAYASECVPCPDTPPLSTRIALGTMYRLPKYNMAPQRGAPPPLRCAPSTCHGPVMLMHAVDERRDATTPVPVG